MTSCLLHYDCLQSKRLRKEDILKEPYEFKSQPADVRRKVGVRNLFINLKCSRCLLRHNLIFNLEKWNLGNNVRLEGC